MQSRGTTAFVSGLRRMAKGVEDDAYEVTAGAHRLRAARKLEMETVPCIVVTDDDLHAELAMIDENLMRAELSPVERAGQTARRKAIYLELHPETARGVAGGNAWQGLATDNLSFADATASEVGRDTRTIQRDAERGEKVCDEALSLVKGTELDIGTILEKIAQLLDGRAGGWQPRQLRRLEDRPRSISEALKRPASLTIVAQ